MDNQFSSFKEKGTFKQRFLYWAYRHTHSTNSRLVVFESCSEEQGINNQLYAIYQEMLNDEWYRDFEFIWVLQSDSEYPQMLEESRTTVVKPGYRKYCRAYTTAKYWVNDNSIPEYVKPRKNQIDMGGKAILPEANDDASVQQIFKNYISAEVEKPSAIDSVVRVFKWFVLKVIRQLIKLLGFTKRYFRKGKKAFSLLWQIILHQGRKHGICFSKNAKKLYAYRDKFKGERCFIMGNGPSLKATDLDTLIHEYTFGSNMIYKIFDQTVWRPTFHCTIDRICARELSAEYKENISSPMFTNYSVYNILDEKPKDIIYVRDYGKTPYQPSKRFLSYYYPSDATVTSFIIELAIFMGFKEIYLLGVDCTNVFGSNGHFISSYLPQEIIDKDIKRISKKLDKEKQSVDAAAQYSIDKSIYAYSRLEEFSHKYGVKIYNATRGGNLEVYERADFDKIEKKGYQNNKCN